ncbi:MAG TPA: O-antigen ligase family protein [Anaerolineae bacterium]|nr:O-antigen ligase family protein [Anaerolineae bacterium]HQK14261.1 O-antigen ligase family protein [Anaerolineae bacterium]
MKRKPILIFALGILLLLMAALGAVQLRAHWRFLIRGRETGFPAPLPDTELPRACVNAALEQYDADTLIWALDTIAEGGFAWVRQRFAWAAIEPAPGEFHWETWDALVTQAQTRNLHLLAVLDTAPDWAGMPPDPAAFARFAGALASRYGDTLTYYQIWHNPNLGDAWGGYADAYAYTTLLAGAAEAIRAADADARIVLGSLAPNVESGERNYAEDIFLEMLYVAGAQPYFDVVAVQPYGFSANPQDRTVGREVFNFSRAILIRETLRAHGDGNKAVWASHFGWNSKPAAWPGPVSIWGSVDEASQAEYTVAALARAEREWPWIGVMCINGFQPRPESVPRAIPDAEEHWGFALVGPDGVPRPVYTALREWNIRPRVATPGGYNAGTALADFEGTWTLGPQGADIGQSGDRVRLTFEGTGVALTVRRGPYRAFLFVTVDGEPTPALPRDREGHAYVVLYDPLAAVATVPLAEHLPYGQHTVEVIAERGWGQWALADWRVANRPEFTPYARDCAVLAFIGIVGLALAFWAGRRVDWGRLGRGISRLWQRLRESTRMILAAVSSSLYLFAAWRVLMGQGVFRRLGDGGELLTLLLAAGLYYFSPWLVLTLAAGAAVSFIVFLQPALGLTLTLFAAPLYMHPLSLLGKSFSLAELILLPTLAGTFLQLAGMWRAGWRPRLPRRELQLVAVFVIVALLSTLCADNQRVAFRELRLVILEPALFYLALVALPLEKHERWRMVDALVCSAVMVAVVGLVQYFFLGDVITAEGGMRRLRSIYGSPNNVGLYLGRVLPLMLAVVFLGGKSPERDGIGAWLRSLWAARRHRFYALAIVPVGAALLLSLSRGAIVLGIPAALLVLGMLGGPKWRRVTLIVLLAGAVALIPLLRTPRFAGMFDLSGGTTGFRMALWYSALGMIREHPLLGVGPDNFLYVYRTRYVLPTAWEEFNLAHPHNVVLDFAARLGIAGLAVFVGLQVAFWRKVWPLRMRHDPELRALALGVMASMADFLAHGMVDAAYFVIDLAFVFFFSLALAAWLNEKAGEGD